jgi:hypothetical protein
VCQRCFTAKNYGRLLPLSVPPEAWHEYVGALSHLHRGVIVLVVDIYDVHDTLRVLQAASLEELAASGIARIDNGASALDARSHSPRRGARATVEGSEGAPAGFGSRSVAPGRALFPTPSQIPLVVVINKVDLLPHTLSPSRLQAWVRGQINATMRQGPGSGIANVGTSAGEQAMPAHESAETGEGAPLQVISAPSSDDAQRWNSRRGSAADHRLPANGPARSPYKVIGVHCVSAAKQYGIRDLAAALQRHKTDVIRPQPSAHGASQQQQYGDVYVIGAPNTGKSTLINAVLSEVWHVPMPAGRAKREASAQAGAEDNGAASDVPRDSASDLSALDDPDVLVPPGGEGGSAGSLADLAGSRRGVGLSAKALSSVVFSAEEYAHARRSMQERQALLAGASAVPGDSDSIDEAALVQEVLRLRRETAAQAAAGLVEPNEGSAGGGAAGGERRGDANRSIPADTAALLDGVLAAHLQRKAGFKQRARKAAADGAPAEGQLPHGPSSNQTPWKAAAGGTDGTAPSVGPPPIPFTTSPLPGTTLGLLGAQLDPHGHSRIWDTPGLIVSTAKQELLEAVAQFEADAVAEQAAADSAAKAASESRSLGRGGRSKSAAIGATDGSTVVAAHSRGPPEGSAPDAGSAAPQATRPLYASTSKLAQLVPGASAGAAPLRVFRLTPGRCLFLGGLARVDYTHSPLKRHGREGADVQTSTADSAGTVDDGIYPLPAGEQRQSGRFPSGARGRETDRPHSGSDRGDDAVTIDIAAADSSRGSSGGQGPARSGKREPLSSLLVTVCSHLPVHVTRSDWADDLWMRHCGTASDSGACPQPSDASAAQAVELRYSASQHRLLQPAFKPLLRVGAVPLLRWATPLQLRAVVEAEALQRLRQAAGPSSGSGGSRDGGDRSRRRLTDRERQEEADLAAAVAAAFEGQGAAQQLRLKSCRQLPEAREALSAALAADVGSAHDRLSELLERREDFLRRLLQQLQREQRGWRQGRASPTGADAAAGSGEIGPLLSLGSTSQVLGSAATLERRRKRTRHNLLDLAYGGLGWLSVTPVEMEGMWGWSRAVTGGALGVAASEGVSVVARQPLLQATASGLSAADWEE